MKYVYLKEKVSKAILIICKSNFVLIESMDIAYHEEIIQLIWFHFEESIESIINRFTMINKLDNIDIDTLLHDLLDLHVSLSK